MPELPEVETIVRGLARGLIGRTVTTVDVPWPSSVRGGKAGLDALKALVGKRFLGTGRRAKLALLHLDQDTDQDTVLAVHLKMTGRLMVYEPGKPVPDDPYLRVRFSLDDGGILIFSDMRRFGWVWILNAQGLAELTAKIGPEPLDTDAKALAQCLAGRRARIKALLLDQSVLAGVGNIYADEALHRAGLRPDRPASDIPGKSLVCLCRELQSVLEQGIAENGASIRDYRDAGGNAGAFQNSFQVYGLAGTPCPRCGKQLEAVKVAGRTSTFCPVCQK